MSNNEQLASIRGLEESLWREVTRFDTVYMNGILAENFLEIGRSGNVYDRAAVLNAPRQPIDAVIPLPNFYIRMLSDSVALVTYDSLVKHDDTVLYAHRSSIWSLETDGWKLQFHQGTAYEPVA